MKNEIAQCRASCSVIDSTPAAFHARSAAARTVDGKNGSRAVRPNTRSSPSRPLRSFSSRSSRRTGNAIGTPRTLAVDFAAIAPAYMSQPRSTRITPPSKSTSAQRSPSSSPRRKPANMATGHSARWSSGSASRSLCAFSGDSIRSRCPRTAGNSNPWVGSTASSPHDGTARAAGRARCGSSTAPSASAEQLDQLLNVGAAHLVDATAAEHGEHVGAQRLRIAARRRGLVRLA